MVTSGYNADNETKIIDTTQAKVAIVALVLASVFAVFNFLASADESAPGAENLDQQAEIQAASDVEYAKPAASSDQQAPSGDVADSATESAAASGAELP